MNKLNTIKFPKSLRYRSGTDNLPIEFFVEAIPAAKKIDLLFGYFSSTAIRTLSAGFAMFLANGGSIRLITNNTLAPRDIEAIKAADREQVEDYSEVLANYDRLKLTLNKYDEHFFECLAYLIQNRRLQLICIKPRSTNGIAHYKCGILRDDESTILFTSSCNFTHFGLLENLEQLLVQRSWGSANEEALIDEEQAYFDTIFDGRAPFAIYLNAEELEAAILRDFGGKELNELISDEEELLRLEHEKIESNLKVKFLLKDIEQDYYRQRGPIFPYPEGPRDYQILAYDKWKENGYKGLFSMATGTGKTLTALNILLEESRQGKTCQAIIIVPTQALSAQWLQEIQDFHFTDVHTTVKNPNWFQFASSLKKRDNLGLETNYIIVTTYATFNGDKFQSFVKELKQTDQLILIADEAHNLGSPRSLQMLPQHIFKRIGLSATPERVYDEEGSQVLYQFFNSEPPCYTFSYSMKKAIDNEILCPYNYHPRFTTLEEDEATEYKRLTLELMLHFNSVTQKFSAEAEFLFLLRKQIIHKARNKKKILQGILQERERIGRLKYTFIYVPEGYEPTYSEVDEHDLEEGDRRIINHYTSILNDYGYKAHQFLGETQDKDRILKQFSDGKIDILLSMKCLDEGVDIPRAETAIFCASTGNPRQFIQRRGRVLRKHPDKTFATIYDLVVIPDVIDEAESSSDFAAYERSMFMNELKRILHFMIVAENRDQIFNGELEAICARLDINLFELYNELIENQNICNSNVYQEETT